MNRRLRTVLIILALAGTWFITLVGGWDDVEAAVGGELASLSHQIRGEADAGTILTGTILSSGDQFGLPTHISVADDHLFVIDQFGVNALTELDRHTGATLRTFGNAGEGPGEFATPVSLFVDGDSTIAVLDAGNNRVTWLRRSDTTFEVVKSVQLGLSSVALDFAPSIDGTLLVAGLFEEARLASLDADGRFLGYVGKRLPLEQLPAERWLEAVQGTLRADPSGTRHVLASRFASRIDVYSKTSPEVTTFWGRERFDPRAGRYATRFGYLDSAPVREGTIALYSGRTREVFPGRANYGSTLHLFDRQGQLEKVYQLDSDVISIASTEDGKRVYGIRHDPVPAVVVYDLP